MTPHTNAFVALLVISHLSAASIAATQQNLITSGAQMRKLAGGFTFTEGPAVDAKGNIYFSDIPNSRIHKWSLESGLSTFREDTEQANGLFFATDGTLLACQSREGRRLVQYPGVVIVGFLPNGYPPLEDSRTASWAWPVRVLWL